MILQRRLLETLDPASPYDGTGQTVKDRLNELAHRAAEINKLSDPSGWGGQLLKGLSEEDLISYFERVKKAGETEARRWALSRQTN